jgi:hypothetical protein
MADTSSTILCVKSTFSGQVCSSPDVGPTQLSSAPSPHLLNNASNCRRPSTGEPSLFNTTCGINHSPATWTTVGSCRSVPYDCLLGKSVQNTKKLGPVIPRRLGQNCLLVDLPLTSGSGVEADPLEVPRIFPASSPTIFPGLPPLRASAVPLCEQSLQYQDHRPNRSTAEGYDWEWALYVSSPRLMDEWVIPAVQTVEESSWRSQRSL